MSPTKIHVKKNKVHRRKKILMFIIFLLLLHILLNIIHVPVKVEVQKNISSPEYEVTSQPKKSINRQCFTREYEWEYEWGGWSPAQNNYISPLYYLINYENITGTFEVYFAFFDQSVHDFNVYRGRDYATVQSQLPVSLSSMVSEPVEVPMQPYTKREITIFTEKKDPTKTYWAYAFVTAPNRTICTREISFENVSQTTRTDESKTTTEDETVRVTLWRLLLRIFGFN